MFRMRERLRPPAWPQAFMTFSEIRLPQTENTWYNTDIYRVTRAIPRSEAQCEPERVRKGEDGMAKRICPICDQIMKSKHYCSACRRFIKQPNIVNGGYYLNERHPFSEVECEYHSPSYGREQSLKKRAESGMPQYGGAQAGRDSGSRPVYERPAGEPEYRRPGPVYAPASGKRAANSPVASVVLIIFVILFLITLLTVLIPLLMLAV